MSVADAADSVSHWRYLPTLIRLGLAVGCGVFVGLEREHHGKAVCLPLMRRCASPRSGSTLIFSHPNDAKIGLSHFGPGDQGVRACKRKHGVP